MSRDALTRYADLNRRLDALTAVVGRVEAILVRAFPVCPECDGTRTLNLSLDGRSGPDVPCPGCMEPPPHDGEGK